MRRQFLRFLSEKLKQTPLLSCRAPYLYPFLLVEFWESFFSVYTWRLWFVFTEAKSGEIIPFIQNRSTTYHYYCCIYLCLLFTVVLLMMKPNPDLLFVISAYIRTNISEKSSLEELIKVFGVLMDHNFRYLITIFTNHNS